jgi:hypothetical protein
LIYLLSVSTHVSLVFFTEALLLVRAIETHDTSSHLVLARWGTTFLGPAKLLTHRNLHSHGKAMIVDPWGTVLVKCPDVQLANIRQAPSALLCKSPCSNLNH